MGRNTIESYIKDYLQVSTTFFLVRKGAMYEDHIKLYVKRIMRCIRWKDNFTSVRRTVPQVLSFSKSKSILEAYRKSAAYAQQKLDGRRFTNADLLWEAIKQVLGYIDVSRCAKLSKSMRTTRISLEIR